MDPSEYGRLEAEVTRSWDALLRSNERRMALTDKVIQNKPVVLTNLQQRTRAMTPNPQSLKNEKSSYQAFDSLQTVMLTELAQVTDGLGAELVQQIRAADDSVLTYRVFYDQAADRYNAYLEEHKKGLAKQTGKVYEELRKPTFTLEK